MLEAVALVARRGANLLAVGVQLLVEPFKIEADAGGAQVLQREQGLRDEVDRGLAAAALETEMKRSCDAIERIDYDFQFAVRVARLGFEDLGGLKVLTAVEPFDRLVDRGRFILGAHRTRS